MEAMEAMGSYLCIVLGRAKIEPKIAPKTEPKITQIENYQPKIEPKIEPSENRAENRTKNRAENYTDRKLPAENRAENRAERKSSRKSHRKPKQESNRIEPNRTESKPNRAGWLWAGYGSYGKLFMHCFRLVAVYGLAMEKLWRSYGEAMASFPSSSG